ncbi:hypothetical protein RclHR1_04700004 [Rhizophagus clarus]|uniref:Uncharacterized protein n=1 Tax=Rhizophagus clarus TaxID=94130 RepID=A0A2Z6S1K2_9GLOM|nr:hypothetical protein RclHR1_04700004 [Rhizophagus clarus]
MFSENFEKSDVVPPSNDIFHVTDDLKKILIYFKNCDTTSSIVPAIDVQVNKLRKQGIEFHSCLQKSIIQSNNFETYAASAINYLEIFKDPNFDQNHISDILEILSDSAGKNVKETEEIKKTYESIRNELHRISEENYDSKVQDQRKLQLLKDKKEELEEGLKRLKRFSIIIFICGSVLLVPFGKEFLCSGISTMVILALLYANNLKTNIQKHEREINNLQKMIDSRKEITELAEIYKNLNPMIIQMNRFNTYWCMQYNAIVSLNTNLEKIDNKNITDNQTLKLVIESTKQRWEETKLSCGDYIRIVRRTITDVDNV